MKNQKRIIAIVLVLMIVAVIAAMFVGCNKKQECSEFKFEYWNDCVAINSLKSFVTAATDEKSPDYIPVEDRIAVFDMDGTLVCETYFTYYDTMMFIEYCLYDHPERVSDELKEVAASIRPGYVADETLARNFAKASLRVK